MSDPTASGRIPTVVREVPWAFVVGLALLLLFASGLQQIFFAPEVADVAESEPTFAEILAWVQSGDPAAFGLVALVVIGLVSGLTGLFLWYRYIHQFRTPRTQTAYSGPSREFGHRLPLFAPWTPWEAIKLLALWMVLQIIFAIPFAIFMGEGAITLVGVVLLSAAGGLTAVWFYLRFRFPNPFRALGWRLQSPLKLISLGLGGYCRAIPVLLLAAVLWGLFLTTVLGVPVQSQELVMALLETDSTALLASIVLLGVVVAPIVEETLFRGLLQTSLRPKFGGWGAILLTSALFALIHFNLFALVPIFVLSVLLGELFERSGSLIPSVLLHALHNGYEMGLLLCVRDLFQTGGV